MYPIESKPYIAVTPGRSIRQSWWEACGVITKSHMVWTNTDKWNNMVLVF